MSKRNLFIYSILIFLIIGCKKNEDDSVNTEPEISVDQYFSFCYDPDINELAEINVESGEITWTGVKIPNYPSNQRGYYYGDSEFIAFGYTPTPDSEPVISRVNLSTKDVSTVPLINPNGVSNFGDVVKE